MRSAWTRTVIVVLSLFVIFVFIGQVFITNRSDIAVETAFRYDFDVEIPFDGVYMRDETLIYDYGSGVLGYECEDGSKVGKSTVIARRYRSENDLSYLRQIETLEEQIEVLTNAEKLIGTDNSQLDAISAQINESHSKIVSDILNGNYDMAVDHQSELLEALCKREITLRESADYSVRKAELNAEAARLKSLLTGEAVDVCADGTGYFASNVDGYESEISFSSFEVMTEQRINEILNKPYKNGIASSAVGKLISDYRWRVAAVLDTENLFGLNQGSTVTLRIGSGSQLVDAEIVYVKQCGENKAVFVFECDRLNAGVVSGRTAKFRIVVDSYGGLRVSRNALRYSDKGEYGVYIVRGSSLVFKKVDIVYWGEDYVISAQSANDGYLMMYDEVVVEGKDLYDGKIVVR